MTSHNLILISVLIHDHPIEDKWTESSHETNFDVVEKNYSDCKTDHNNVTGTSTSG